MSKIGGLSECACMHLRVCMCAYFGSIYERSTYIHIHIYVNTQRQGTHQWRVAFHILIYEYIHTYYIYMCTHTKTRYIPAASSFPSGEKDRFVTDLFEMTIEQRRDSAERSSRNTATIPECVCVCMCVFMRVDDG
jgi:hypothetical protein